MTQQSTPGHLSKKKKKKPRTLILKDTFTPMFKAALFIIANIWKQPKCPATDE